MRESEGPGLSYGEMRQAYDWEVNRLELLLDPMGRGFATFKLLPDGLYVAEVWVRPSERRNGVSWAMLARLETIARQFGRTQIIGTVDANTMTWRESVAAQEAMGFVLSGIDDRGHGVLIKTLAPQAAGETTSLVSSQSSSST